MLFEVTVNVFLLNRMTNFEILNLYQVPHSSCTYALYLVSTALLVPPAKNGHWSYTCIYKLLEAGLKYSCI